MKQTPTKDGFVGELFPELFEEERTPSQPQNNPSPQVALKQKNAELELKVKELQKENDRLKDENERLRSKAESFDELMQANSPFPTNIVAKSFGWSAIKLNQYLKEKKVQYQHGEVWVLYQKYANHGYTQQLWYEYGNRNGKPQARAHTYWTMKGIQFIRELLKNDGLLPE